LNKLNEKNNKYKEYLKKIIMENPQSLNQEKEEGEIETMINLDNNINNEKQNEENNINAQKVEKPLSEEKYKFLKEKFESKPYDRSYIVKCLQKDLEDYQKYIEDEIANKK
jgi:hypothetical protein